MKYLVKYTSQYKKEYKLLSKRGYDLTKLNKIVELLASGATLPKECRDHPLLGNFKGARECHIEGDWLLIYKIFENELILMLSRTGTHSDLF